MAHARPASLSGTEVAVVACEMAMIYLRRPGLAGIPVNDETGGEPRAVAFSPDGARFGVAVDNRLTLWDTANVANPSTGVTIVPHEGPITALAFVVTLGDVSRFPRGKQVGSYLGLIPR